MLVPTAEFPHFCSQCEDYPCASSCEFNAISVDEQTGAVIVDKDNCTACGLCIKACPGEIPHIHPTKNYALICDLCGGNPLCAEICQQGSWDALWVVKRDENFCYSLYAKKPEELTQALMINLYGEKGKELF